jgi:16S rRNA (guanine966-N2)-methyltransferase
VRIIRGKLKSRRLAVPKGFNSRPTTNFSKEALFNIIDNRFDLEDKRILDLCAGTGNISLEFVSGGVAHVLAVEQNFKCVRFLQGLATQLEIEKELTVLKSDAVQFLERTDLKFDFIFADPPYDVPIHEQIANLIFERNLLNEDGIVVIEHGKQTDFSKHPHFNFERKYGAVHFAFLQ